MAIVELHGAFVWDCEECGRENFERAIEGDLSDEIADDISGVPAVELMAPADESSDDPNMMQSAVLISRIVVIPRTVTCKHCGVLFDSAVLDEEDFE